MKVETRGGHKAHYFFSLSATFVLASALLSGCEYLKATERVSPFFGRSEAVKNGAGGLQIADNATVKDLRIEEPKPIDLDKLTLPGDHSELAYVRALDSKRDRNRLQDYMQGVSDEVCDRHKADILAVASINNSVFSGVTTLLSGAGGLVTGVTAARVLSGGGAISNATRENFNENVFYNQVATAIVRQIDQQRKQKLLEIAARRREDTDTYSVDAAIVDIAAYHRLCSFAEGVAALATDGKRPPSAGELRDRIASLNAQIKNNNDLINDPKTPNRTKAILQKADDDLARMIETLTVQLGLVQNVPSAANDSASTDKQSDKTKKETP